MKRINLLKIAGILSFFFLAQQLAAINADIVVAKDGSGNFTKIQDAINAVPSNQTDRRTVIFIKNGLYNTEKLLVPADKINITLIGESRDQTIISYHIYDCTNAESGNKCPAADANLWIGDVIRTSATLTIMGEGFRAENMTIQNTAGPVGQALAITVMADKTAFINVNLLGYQDTIYLWTAGKRTYFQGCLVLGRTDYIYGAGIGYFEACEIRSYGGGYITAPSTPQTQAFGFVFNHCELTYTAGSPRVGDDGVQFRLGRPWHEYPKVSWLNCNITGMLNPQGWGDIWGMDYAATSTDLHLYEYNNTGPGADMSGRAAWAGLRAMTADEAVNYTKEKVLAGSDGWAPYADVPLATTYNWDGGGADASWLSAANWNPDGVPATAEAAYISGNVTVNADGGQFNADLNLQESSTLKITAASTATYLTILKATILAETDVTFGGKIATKDTTYFQTSGNLTLSAKLQGVHKIIKKGSGNLILGADNSGFSGEIKITSGKVEAGIANSLGKATVEVLSGATLQVGNSAAYYVKASLKTYTGSTLNLLADITLSEFYIDGKLQNVGTYNATTNPNLITGTGNIVVGRPAVFKFAGGVWDVVANYSPALLPLEGESVLCEGEMETSATVNKASVTFVSGKGKLRLRGAHTSTGTLTFEGNQRISYATSGAGMSINAPIVLLGNISTEMSSANATGNSMTLNGTITGNVTVSVKNTRSTATLAKLILGGNNEGFTGIWDVTTAGLITGATAGIAGTSANAFGKSTIKVGANNLVQFDHASCVSSANTLILNTGAKAVINADVTLGSLTIGTETFSTGSFGATTHPAYFSGTGTITLAPNAIDNTKVEDFNVYYKKGHLNLYGNYENVKVYTLDGIILSTPQNSVDGIDINLSYGVYLVSNGKGIVRKFMVNN
jgi:autotransporter-associated beta strand protein